MKVINIIFNWFSTPLKPKNTEIAPNIDKPSWILANMLAEKLLTKELDITVSESSAEMSSPCDYDTFRFNVKLSTLTLKFSAWRKNLPLHKYDLSKFNIFYGVEFNEQEEKLIELAFGKAMENRKKLEELTKEQEEERKKLKQEEQRQEKALKAIEELMGVSKND